MAGLNFDLHCVGLLAAGLGSLDDLRNASHDPQLLKSAAPIVLPTPRGLPANERRRASPAARLVLACIDQALRSSPFPAGELRSVFASDDGIGEVSQQMLDVLSGSRQVSPLMFPNSVHCAAAGYYSMAFQNHESATVVSYGLESFAGGLLCAVTEALATEQPILFVSYDCAMTAPMDELLPIREPLAAAWIISAGSVHKKAAMLGAFHLILEDASPTSAPSLFPEWLPKQWASSSCAKGLAALGLLHTPGPCSYRFSLGEQVLTLSLAERSRR